MKYPLDAKQLGQDYFDLAIVFFVLLVSYAVKFAELVELDVVVVGWTAVMLYALYRVRLSLFFIPAIFYLVLFLAYLSGAVFVPLNPAELEYGRVLLTSFILSTLVFGLMIKKNGASGIAAGSSLSARWIPYLGLIAITAWTIFVYTEGKNIGGSVVKEYGGANYLTSSDLLAMFSLSVLGSRNISTKESLIFFAISVMALIFLGSRASLLIFCVAYIFCVGQIRGRNKLIIFFGVLLIAVALGLAVQSDESDLFFRFKTLYDLGGDESLTAREVFFSSYVSTIDQRVECLFLPCMPASGDYVHSIISVHQYFGIAGVVAIAFLLALVLMYYLKFRNFLLPGLFFYVCINMFFARAWVSLVFPVFIGMLLFFATKVLVATKKGSPLIGKTELSH
ncbi:hypothetical protein [Variovorax sp. Varisp62]|uniref:hypothetical protein n=1 Tax=Variovorax sp. Varisp62 TaxID=3243049 RepID=UPI0039B52956